MSTAYIRPRRASRRGGCLLVFLFLLSVCAGGFYYAFFWSNRAHEAPDFGGVQKPVFYMGKQWNQTAVGEKDSLQLPFSFYRDRIDPSIRYENAGQSVIFTNKSKVIRIKVAENIISVNEKPSPILYPAELVGNDLYLPVETLKKEFGLDILESETTGAVMVRKAGDEVHWGKVKGSSAHPNRTIPLRAEATRKAPIYADLKRDEPVMIWGEKEGWYWLQLQNGYTGFAKKSDIVYDRTETVPPYAEPAPFVPWKPASGKINLTWQQVANKGPDPAQIGPMPGLNVISPQWFHLKDGDGSLISLADPNYAKWARDRGYQLWALFSNSFEPKRTTEALASYDKRVNMIKQLLVYADTYKLQGINVDFENVSLADKENMVQFIREMAPLLHEKNLVLSIDVTVKDGSANYSLFMNRQMISESVDYMMVMTYDEHWAASPKAGSVASLPWVENGIERILQEDQVPPSKLLLGVPFYTRLWTEETKDGKTAVSSKTLSMEAAQALIKEKKLTPSVDEQSGQHYVEFEENGKTMKVWIEDSFSIQKRLDLMNRLGLAGVASWSRSLETPDIWGIIGEAVLQ